MRREEKLYNILFPIWLIIWFPTWIWLILIPLNYIVDHFVLFASLEGMENRKYFARDHAWMICLVGFLCDAAGSLFLLASMLLTDRTGLGDTVGPALNMNPFRSPLAVILTALAVALAGILIFLADRRILRKYGLTPDQAKKSAMLIAALTAPYLFFVPSEVIYR